MCTKDMYIKNIYIIYIYIKYIYIKNIYTKNILNFQKTDDEYLRVLYEIYREERDIMSKK